MMLIMDRNPMRGLFSVVQHETPWSDLFSLLSESQLSERDTGLVATVHFHAQTRYAVLAFTPFRTIKNTTLLPGQGVTFRAEGERIFVLYEPADYPQKFQEPYLRDSDQAIPLRFTELALIKLHNNDRIMINRDAYFSTGSISLQEPTESNFAMYIHDHGTLEDSARDFLDRSLREDFHVSAEDRATVLNVFGAHVHRIHTTTA